MAIEDKSQFKLVPMQELIDPTKPSFGDAYILYRDRWWVVFEEQVLFYKGTSPQCNPNEAIATRLAPSWATAILLIPRAWIPIKVYGSFDFECPSLSVYPKEF